MKPISFIITFPTKLKYASALSQFWRASPVTRMPPSRSSRRMPSGGARGEEVEPRVPERELSAGFDPDVGLEVGLGLLVEARGVALALERPDLRAIAIFVEGVVGAVEAGDAEDVADLAQRVEAREPPPPSGGRCSPGSGARPP
jgi:hypothetical protein